MIDVEGVVHFSHISYGQSADGMTTAVNHVSACRLFDAFGSSARLRREQKQKPNHPLTVNTHHFALLRTPTFHRKFASSSKSATVLSLVDPTAGATRDSYS